MLLFQNRDKEKVKFAVIKCMSECFVNELSLELKKILVSSQVWGHCFSGELREWGSATYSLFGGVCWASPPSQRNACSLQPRLGKAVGACLEVCSELLEGWKDWSGPPINVSSHLTLSDLPTQPHLLLADPLCSCGHGGKLWPLQQSGLSLPFHGTQTHSLPLPWVWTPWSPQGSAQAGICRDTRGPSEAFRQQSHSLKGRYLVSSKRSSHLSSITRPWAPMARSTRPSIVRSWPPLSDWPKYWSPGETWEPWIRWG